MHKESRKKETVVPITAGWESVPVDQRCYRVDVGGLHGRNPEYTESYLDYYFGNWQCERIYDWVYFPDDRDGNGNRDGERPGGGGGTSCPAGYVRDANGNCVKDDSDPEPCKTTVKEVENAIANVDSGNLSIVIKFINEFGGKFGIDNETRLQHFLAQTAHETTSPVTGKRFGAFEENLNYSKETLLKKFHYDFPDNYNPDNYANNPQKMAEYLYGSYKDLGNTQPGDGWKFRGRGVIQLTGRDNYERFTDFYQEEFNSSLDFTQNPDLLTSDDKIAVVSGLWFFDWRVSETITDQTTVEEVTEQVNGGTNGLADRENLFEKFKQFINDCFA